MFLSKALRPRLRTLRRHKFGHLLLAGLASLLIASGALWIWVQHDDRAAGADSGALSSADKQALGLMTSLPIYWAEGDAFAQLGEPDAALPWVRQTLEQRYRIVPLDSLVGDDTSGAALEDIERLAIIQPRGLSPADNVVLDNWVRAGGTLFYAIDPLLAGEYEFALGDPRHPTLSALVPPVLARWGLELRFDEGQDDQPRLAQWDEVEFPVVMGGQLSPLAEADPAMAAECKIEESGIAAHCGLGEGSVTIIADAALFEPREGNSAAQSAILALLAKALP